MSDDPKKDVEGLMNELLDFAEKMLSEYGEFHPFGGYRNARGEIVHVGVKLPSPEATARARIDVLIRSFKGLARQGKGQAFAVATNVTLPTDGGLTDAVKFFLEHKAGYCAEVFFCYAISSGAVQITDTIAQRGEPIFFNPRN